MVRVEGLERLFLVVWKWISDPLERLRQHEDRRQEIVSVVLRTGTGAPALQSPRVPLSVKLDCL